MRIGSSIGNLLSTIKFFTILPIPVSVEPGLERLAVWTPWAGLVVGGFLVAAHYLTGWLFHPILAAALVLCVWITITGGLHLDGLGDCGDAFPASTGSEQRLSILRDPHLGAFGVMAIVLAIVIKLCAIIVLPSLSWNTIIQRNVQFPFALLFAPVAARWLVLWASRTRFAGPEGMGVMYARGANTGQILLAGILPIVLLGINGLLALAAMIIAGGGVWIVTRIAKAQLGGINGDVLGACIEVAEVIILLVYAARLNGA